MNDAGPATYRVLLGRQLRALRERAGVSREDAAGALQGDTSKVSRVEQGSATLKPGEVNALLSLYAADEGTAADIRDLGEGARRRGQFGKVPNWARQYLGLEADASSIHCFDGELVPGLFQTRDYARAVVSTSPVVAAVDIDRVVDARMKRQVLLERPEPPDTHLILGEAALRRAVGGCDTLGGQLEHLIEVGKGPVTVQILPFVSGEHAALGCSFTLLDLALSGTSESWVYLEDLTRADCLPGEGHVSAYRLTWTHLASKALPARESMAMLERTLTDLAR